MYLAGASVGIDARSEYACQWFGAENQRHSIDEGAKMRIAYILPSLAAKAPVFIAKRLSDYFIGKGDLVSVFYFDDKTGIDFMCPMHRIKMSEPIDFDSFDIIHSHMMRPDRYVSCFSHRIRSARTVSTVHCDIRDDLRWSYGTAVSSVYARRWLSWLKSFDATVQINDFLMDLYAKTLSQNHLIYNGVSVSPEQDDYTEIVCAAGAFRERGLSVVCSYSGIVRRKGLKQILRLLEMRHDIAYICIGDGKQKQELEDYARRAGISGRILFSPFKKNPCYVMRHVDVFMIPSHSEGFPLALLEAGSIGASAVCSDIPAFSPFSEREVSKFRLGDICSMSRAVDEALRMKAEKSAALKNRIAERFSEEKMFAEYERLYRVLMAQRQTAT